MAEQVKQIYLEYCTTTEIEPLQEVLNVLEEKEVSCRIYRGLKESLNELQPNEMYALCLVLSQNLDSFLELEIYNNPMEGSYLSMLANALATNTHLQRLTILNGSIEDEGVQSIAGVLVENNPLQELNISQNMVKDVGAEAIAFILQAENCHLDKLNLSHNMIQTDYFSAVLEGKTSLTELDLSYNNYPAESIEAILKGASNNNTLLRLNLEGMKGATNINAMALVDLVKKNMTLQEIGIDINLSLLDENLRTKLEEALMENITLVSLVSPPLEISLNNPSTEKIYKLLKANEWIATNYEKLCNNEAVDCHDYIEDFVKAKLELLANKMAEADSASHHGSIVEEAEEHSMQESPAPRKEEEYPAVKEFQINGKQRSTVSEKENLEVSTLFIPKSLDVTTEEQNVPNINWGLEKNNIDEKLKAMQEQIEQRLASQFTKMVDEKVSDQLKGVSTQIKTIVNRLDHLENKVVSIEKELVHHYHPTAKAIETQNRNEINLAALEGRLASMEAQVAVVDKLVKTIDSIQKDELTRRPVEDVDYIERIKTLETQEGIGFETLLTERMNFEKSTRENFGEVFKKLEEFESMMDQVLQDQLKEQELVNKQLGNSVNKEKVGIEKIVNERVGELLAEKFEKLEGSFKTGVTNLRNAVYDTQNRVKDLEHCILENTELDFRGWKKKVNPQQNQAPPQTIQSTNTKANSTHTATIKNQNTSTIRNQNPLKNKVNNQELNKSQNGSFAKTKEIKPKASLIKSQLNPNTSSQGSNAILVQDLSYIEPESALEISEAEKRSRTEMSPITKKDDPLSLNELQGSLLGSHVFKQSVEKSVTIREDLNSKSLLRDNAISNLPANIRKVKEEIKRKIEDYRAAISPYKKEKENSIGESRSAQKVFTDPRFDYVDSGYNKMRKSLRAEPVGRNIQPSDELVLMLKTRGFAFTNNQ